ncbi:MAG: LLM class F420-dependent oxidoreductase [Actinomycetota bacterium]
MRFSIGLPTDQVEHAAEFVTGDAIAECAAAFEDMGFDACFVTDHPAPDAKWLATGGHHALDPFVALSFAAAATTRLRLQTHILVLPYRNPLLTAKSVLSLDVLSGGRVTLGVASGYLKPEFFALGAEFERRNELTDEAIAVIRGVLTTDEFEFDGRHFNTRGTTMHPRPVQRPTPPIWIGGNSTAAIRRAAAQGDGWVPFPNPPSAARTVRTPHVSSVEDLAERVAVLRDEANRAGRVDVLDICCAPFTPNADRQALRDEIDRLADAGVTWCTVGSRKTTTRREFLDDARGLAETLLDR